MSDDIQWLKPYAKSLPDGSLQIGIDLVAHYTVKPENVKGYRVDDQLTWLAVTYANKLIEYALEDTTVRQQAVKEDGEE